MGLNGTTRAPCWDEGCRDRAGRSTVPLGREALAETAPFPPTDPYIQQNPVSKSTYIQNTTLSLPALLTKHILTHPHPHGIKSRIQRIKKQRTAGRNVKRRSYITKYICF